MAARPADWPEQKIVELDNLGDPGGGLEVVLGNPTFDVLFGLPFNEDVIAEALAKDYLPAIRKLGYPLPSDFGDKPTGGGGTHEEELQVRAQFAAFIRPWRER